MSSAVIQLIVLAGIAIFLILRLRNTLGTRNGFEKPPAQPTKATGATTARRDFEVIEGGTDHDIADHIDPKSKAGLAVAAMKKAEPEFSLNEFLNGARGAYEMILTAFEGGDKDTLKKYLSDDVYTSFTDVIETREADGLHIDMTFIGVRELKMTDASFNEATKEGEVTIKFVGEMTSVARNKDGEITEGNPQEVKRQKDIWTFSRIMGSNNPNWQLVATGG